MNKAQLLIAFGRLRNQFETGQLYANEYALRLDELLAGYLRQRPLADPPEEEP